jgi:predicted permease
MRWLTRCRLALRSIVRRRTVDAELEAELQFFMQRRTEDFLAAGASADEAALEARRAVGSLALIRDECHDARGTRWVDALLDDAGHGIRLLARHPGFALTTVLLIAMSITVGSAAVALLDAVLLRALPAISRPDQLAMVSGVGPNDDRRGQSLPMFELLQQQRQGTTEMFGYRNYGGLPATIGGATIPLRGIGVIGNYFEALPNLPLLRGRPFDPNSDAPNALISARVWQEQFGGSPDVVGATLTMGTVAFTVVGVVSPEFLGLQPDLRWDVIAPFTTLNRARGLSPAATRNQIVYTVVRLSAGVTMAQYEARLAARWPEILAQTVPTASTLEQWVSQRGPRVVVESLRSGQSFTLITNPGLPRALELTAALAAMIFLTSCVTLALLVVARAVRQQRDTAIRLALGGDRWRVLRPYVVESVCLSALGCAVGLLLSSWAVDYGAQYVPGDWTVSLMPWGVVSAVLMATLSVTVGAGLVAFMASRGSIRQVIQQTSRTTQPHVRLRQALLTTQVVATVVLTYATLLYVDDFRRLTRMPTGMDVDHLKVYQLVGKLPYQNVSSDYFQRLTAALEATKGVESVALSIGSAPLGYLRDFTEPIETVEGGRVNAYVTCVFPGVFTTWGTPQVSGRDLAWSDGPAVVITASLASRLYPSENPLGRVIRTLTPRPAPYQVVGVVGNMAFNGPRLGTRDVAFVPCLQRTNPLPSSNVVAVYIRSSSRTLADMKGDVTQIAERLGVHYVMDDVEQTSLLASSVQQERMLATVSGAFGAVVVFVTAVGLYAFGSYMLTFRTRELAVRVALGAGSRAVVTTLVRELLVVFGVGLTFGLGVALILHRGLLGVVGDLGPIGWHTPSRVVAILAGVFVMASASPAIKAVRIDLADALRLDE